MNKKCVLCGIELDETVTVCPKCGIRNPTKKPDFPAISQPEASPKKKPKILPFFLAGAVVVVLVATLLLLGLFDNNPTAPPKQPTTFETLLDNALAFWNGKSEVLESLAPPEYWESGARRYNCTKEQYINIMDRDLAIQHKSNNPNGDIIHTGKILSTNEMSDQILQEISVTLATRYGISESSISAGKELSVQIQRISLEETITLQLTTLYAIEINNIWYLLINFGAGETLNVAFFII